MPPRRDRPLPYPVPENRTQPPGFLSMKPLLVGNIIPQYRWAREAHRCVQCGRATGLSVPFSFKASIKYYSLQISYLSDRMDVCSILSQIPHDFFITIQYWHCRTAAWRSVYSWPFGGFIWSKPAIYNSRVFKTFSLSLFPHRLQ